MATDPLARLSIHTMTTKPWSLEQATNHYARAGVRGITVWRPHLEPYGAARARRMLQGTGLACTALCQGGFFPAPDSARRMAALDDNRRAIADAAAVGAPMLVLVCGAVPGLPLGESRRMIRDGIRAIEPDARAAGVVLAVEPLHPMHAADCSAITTLAEARRLCETIASPFVKIAYDVFHVWWDPDLEEETTRCRDLIAGFHICDWHQPLRDMLNDRAVMGEGVIPVSSIRQQVRAGGFTGWDEVEIFSDELWGLDQALVLDRIVRAYRALG